MGNEQMENTVPKIYAAILGVMNEVGAVSKEKTCKSNFGSYKFRGIDDVMNALHPAMVKNRVFAIPEILEMTREVKTSAKGTPMTSSICKVRYDFFTDDGSKVSCTVIGEGMDTGDKATNKAMSIAFKYACFQTFCIPTEDMERQKNHRKRKHRRMGIRRLRRLCWRQSGRNRSGQKWKTRQFSE